MALVWTTATTNQLVGTQCVEQPYIDAGTNAVIFPICWRRSCLVSDSSLDNVDINLAAYNMSLPAKFQGDSVGIALTLLRPSCARNALAEGNPSNSAKFNTLLFNEADTVRAPAGGLASFTASIMAPGGDAQCDDKSATFLLNAMPLVIEEVFVSMCPRHAVPDSRNGNRECPAGKVKVFLDITDAAYNKLPDYPTVIQVRMSCRGRPPVPFGYRVQGQQRLSALQFVVPAPCSIPRQAVPGTWVAGA